MDPKGRYVQQQKDSDVDMVEEEMKLDDAWQFDKYHKRKKKKKQFMTFEQWQQ